MPMVKKARNCLALAAIACAACGLAQTSYAQEWRNVLAGNPQSSSGRLSGISTDAGSFQFAYGREIGGMLLAGTVAREQSGLLPQAVQADETRQLRLHAGYDFGPATGFVSLGGLQAETSEGSRRGAIFGLGMRVSLNRALQLTGELLHHEAGPENGSASARGETLSVSAAFRF